MPQEQEQTTGTPEPEITDAQASGNQVEDGGDADYAALQDELRNLREQQKLALGWKDKAERVNQLEAEVQQLKTQSANTSPTMTNSVQQQQAAMNELAAAIQEAEYEASQGDRKAMLLVATLRRQAQLEQQNLVSAQLQHVPVDDRNAVQQKLATGRFADAQAAHDSVIADRYRSGATSTPAPETPSEPKAGTGRPMPVTGKRSGPQQYTMQEYGAEYDRIMASLGPEAARNFARKEMRGDIIVK